MMRNKIILILLMFVSVTSNGQEYRNGLGVHVTGVDFYGPQTGKYFLQDKVNVSEGESEKRLFWDPAAMLSYWHQLNSHFDVMAGLSVSALQYPVSDKDSMFIKSKTNPGAIRAQLPFVYLDVRGVYNFVPRFKHMLTPYVSAGFSPSLRENDLGLDLPAGIGCHVLLGKGVSLNLQSDYRLAMNKKNQNHLTHQLGLVYFWKSSKKVKAPVPVKPVTPVIPVVVDSDNDGIPDKDDSCPTLAGRKEMKGCPDKDGDGIADMDDFCPETKGLKQYNGCPDTDQDGIQDNKDDCPTVSGLAKYKGCPVPDTDKDGFNDEVDKCPTVASTVNNGCPEIKEEVKKKIDMAAAGIYFESGSAVIKSASFKNLDKIVELLNAEQSYLVDIEGHTDNTGEAAKNLELSQKRADACKNYLISKGIAVNRTSSKGFGDTRPVEPNTTAVGKAKNRRTEFRIRNY